MDKTTIRCLNLSTLMCFLFSGLVPTALAQQPETTRDIWLTAYGSTDVALKSGDRRRKQRRYRNLTPRIAAQNVANDSVLGVTIWQLRPSRPADRGERILIHSGPESTQWVPVRVPANSPLTEGSLVRLSIEPARTGYLYVIDREQYTNGSFGEPMLIFPTLKIRNGDNAVNKSQLIEVPDRRDDIPCFRLERSRPDHIGESLTVLIMPQPFAGLTISDEPLKLDEAQVIEWEKRWGKQTGQLELSNSVGRSWTKEEKEAGADATRVLKAGDPVPQTVFYSPDAKSGDPLLVNLRLP